MLNTVLILDEIPELSNLAKSIIESKTSLSTHVATSLDNLFLFNQTQQPTICVLALNFKNTGKDDVGLEYLMRMRKINPNLYCILTGSTFHKRTQAQCYGALPLENTGYLGKPYDVSDFLSVLELGLKYVKSLPKSA